MSRACARSLSAAMESADSAAQEAQTAFLAMGPGFFEQMRSSGAEEGAQRTEVLDAFRKR